MSRKRELAKNTAILTVGRICSQLVSFFLLPLYTAILSKEDYGTFDLFITYGTLLLPIVNLQLDQGLFRFMLDYRGDDNELRKIFSSVSCFNVFQCFVFGLVILIVQSFIRIKHLKFLFFYVVCLSLVMLLQQFVRGLGRSKVYAIGSFILASSTIVFNVFMLVVLKKGIEGLFIATISAQMITIGYFIINCKAWRYFSFSSFNREVLKEVSSYSIPLIPNNLAWWVVNVSDRTVISYFLGVAANGIYTVSNKFSGAFIQVYNIFNLSWTETVSLHFDDDDRDEFLSETITTIFSLFSCACFCIVAIMPFIFPLLVNTEYADAYSQIIILMYAMLLRILVGLYSTVYIAEKNSKKVATTSFISAIINLATNIVLISRIGLYAASLSTLLAFGSMAIVRYIDINKSVKMRIKRGIIYSSVIISVVLLVSYYLNNAYINSIVLIAIIVYSYLVNKDFIKSVIKMIKNKLGKKGTY